MICLKSKSLLFLLIPNLEINKKKKNIVVIVFNQILIKNSTKKYQIYRSKMNLLIKFLGKNLKDRMKSAKGSKKHQKLFKRILMNLKIL